MPPTLKWRWVSGRPQERSLEILSTTENVKRQTECLHYQEDEEYEYDMAMIITMHRGQIKMSFLWKNS